MSIPDRPETAGAQLKIQQCLENRHLAVLANILMQNIEEEQKKFQLLVRFAELLEYPDDCVEENQQSFISEVEDTLIFELQALCQVHSTGHLLNSIIIGTFKAIG